MSSVIRKISLNLNNSPLSTSLRKLFFTIWFLPYVFISIISLCFLSHSLINKEFEIAQSSFEITQTSLRSILNNIYVFSDRISVNPDIIRLISGDYDYTSVEKLYKDELSIEELLESNFNDVQEVASYRLFIENSISFNTSFIIQASESIKSEEWYNVAIRQRGQTFWMYKQDSISENYYLCLVRSLWDSYTGKFLGTLVVNVNPMFVEEQISSKVFRTVVLFNNEIIYNSNGTEINDEQQEKFINLLKNYDFNNPKISFLNRGIKSIGVLAYKFLPGNNLNFKLAFIFSFNNVIGLSLKILLFMTILLITLGLLTILLTRIFNSYIDSRVNKIQTGIKSVVSNNFAIPPAIDGNDEFQDIYHSLYEMSNNIKSLINQVYAQNLEKEQLASRQNEIRFKMLSTQINPHFLFNTLETIRMKSLSTGDREVATMLKQLASLLRYNLNITGKPVSFYDELNAVQNYLYIQHVRFGHRITHDIMVLCDIRRIQILPLIIQPIIENSFSHGLENTAENGFIYILCETVKEDSEEILKISISDNGSGIEKNKLNELRSLLNNPFAEDNATSIGIFNVNSRIKLFYGQKYGLSLESQFGEGTTITIRLPLIYLNENNMKMRIQ